MRRRPAPMVEAAPAVVQPQPKNGNGKNGRKGRTETVVSVESERGVEPPRWEERRSRQIVDALFPAGVDLSEIVQTVVEEVFMQEQFDAAGESAERRRAIVIPRATWSKARDLVLDGIKAWQAHVTAALPGQKDAMFSRLLDDARKLRVGRDYEGAHRAERQIARLLGVDAPKRSAFVGALATGKFGDEKLKTLGFSSEPAAVEALGEDADIIASLSDADVAELVNIGKRAEGLTRR